MPRRRAPEKPLTPPDDRPTYVEKRRGVHHFSVEDAVRSASDRQEQKAEGPATGGTTKSLFGDDR